MARSLAAASASLRPPAHCSARSARGLVTRNGSFAMAPLVIVRNRSDREGFEAHQFHPGSDHASVPAAPSTLSH
jgi:hypothetical protein